MKLPEPGTAALRVLRKLRTSEPTDRRWHPSVLEFTDGVEVTEIQGTLPGDLQELFGPHDESPPSRA